MYTSCNEKVYFIPFYGRHVVQHLIDFNASLFESLIDAVFQIGFMEPAVVVVPLFGEGLVNVAPFNVTGASLETPRVRHFIPAPKCKFLGVSKYV